MTSRGSRDFKRSALRSAQGYYPTCMLYSVRDREISKRDRRRLVAATAVA